MIPEIKEKETINISKESQTRLTKLSSPFSINNSAEITIANETPMVNESKKLILEFKKCNFLKTKIKGI